MIGLSRCMSMSIGLGADPGSQTAIQVDTAFVFETSGEAMFVRFVSPVTQVSATLTLYFYPSAVTGSPTYQCELRNSAVGAGDPDRPEAGGAALATSGNVSPTASQWSTFTVTVSLTKGSHYYALLKNTHATPASNHASWVYRGACDHFNPSLNTTGYESGFFQTGYTNNGFTGDPTINGSLGTAVLKFDDGTIVGFPYIDSETHASNTNDRGNRLSFTADIKVLAHSIPIGDTNLTNLTIYNGASTVADHDISAIPFLSDRAGLGWYGSTTLTASTDYDFVIQVGAADIVGIIYNMGEAEGALPADVLACRPTGFGGYADGATPGSYTVDASKVLAMQIFPEDLVAGGGGGCKLAGPGGGMVG